MAKKKESPYNNIERALSGEDPIPEDLEVEVEMTEEVIPMDDEDVEIVMDEDGGATINMGPEEEETVSRHEENLAERLDDDELAMIAADILTLFDADKASREEWEKTYAQGMKLLGFQYEEKTQPFRGASGANVPLLTESILQFSAQAMKELMPAAGPVRTQVIGKSNRNREMQAERVKEFMNYQITTVMKEYTPDFDQMLWYVGYGGSAFKKVYFDRDKMRCVSPFIPPDNFVMPYNGSSNPWENERCIQIVPTSSNMLRMNQVNGFYRDIPLTAAAGDTSQIEDAEDKVSGRSPNEMDEEYTLLEAHILYDVPGFEDKDGIKRPYIITVDKDSGEVLSIYRNWKEDDETYTPRHYYVHYMFLPGPGSMGYGLVHLLGNLNRAATSALQQLLDAGTFANLPAGFKARGLRIADSDKPLQPGEFRDIDAGGAELSSALLPLPYKEPSQTLFTLLGFCIDMGRRVASIADLQVGDGNQQAAVGTTIALLERGAMVMSGIHKRLHYAQKLEFELMAECFSQYLPPEYPYDVVGGDRKVFKKDFDDRVDVIPVADPNVFSTAQKIMMAQTQLQLAQSAPQIHNLYEAYRRMYEALGTKDIDMLLKPDDTLHPRPKDPASENADALDGKNLTAFAGQQHDAHIVCHLIQGMSPIVQGNPLAAAVLTKHILDHVRLKAEEQTEAQIFAAYGPEGMSIVSDIQKEAQVAMFVAQGMAELRKLSQEMSGANAPDPLVALKEQELQLRAQDQQAKAQMDQQELALKAQDMQQDAAFTQQKIQSNEQIAAEKADIARARLAQTERSNQNAAQARFQQQNNQQQRKRNDE
jgi:hypothetical protein